jgi:glycogen debranching enzyme
VATCDRRFEYESPRRPHLNSIIAAGFRRYGFDEAMGRLFDGIVQAAMHLAHYRLPELLAGFSRQLYGVLVYYPVACGWQAWAPGAVPFLLETLLGLQPRAFDHRLEIVRPMLPGWMHCLEMNRLSVGQAQTDLRFERQPNGSIKVTVVRVDGPLDVKVRTEE